MKAYMYLLFVLIGYIVYKRDPMLLLFGVGAYLLYRYLAGSHNESEKKYWTAMTTMASSVTRGMSIISGNLDQLNANIERMSRPTQDAFITDSDESDFDEFDHLS